MTVTTAREAPANVKEFIQSTRVEGQFAASGVLAFSIWCGLAAGLLEVMMVVLSTRFGKYGIYQATRHFVWMIPLTELFLLSGLGVVLAFLTKLWARRGGWLSARLLGALALLPAFSVMYPRIYPIAMIVVTMGIASRIATVVERDSVRFRPLYRTSFVLLSLAVASLPAWLFASDALAARRESARPLPKAGSPNVLLIVLDTVRVDHLSLYGYSRPTSPNLERLAQHGIRFDAARSTAPWTLPSHASMFTGRWPHELSVGPRTPLDGTMPTLAEYLGLQGYATAGFVANMEYCTWGTGLARGFTRYEDRVTSVKRLKIAKLADLSFQATVWLGNFARDYLTIDLLTPLTRLVFAAPTPSSGGSSERGGSTRGPATSAQPNDFVNVSTFSDSQKEKNASQVNRQFLDWLSSTPDQRRPFFAFLNYMDAHDGYVLPTGFEWRFGERPKTKQDAHVIADWFYLDKTRLSEREVDMGRDAYDNCIAYLDDQLGKLFDELTRRGVLDQTLVILTADHGENFGEHGLFGHGCSLYQTEIHVPLLIVLPKCAQVRGIVDEVVTLRDLPPTVVDALGIASNSPFPGRSLARLWNELSGTAPRAPSEDVISEVNAPPPLKTHLTQIPAARGPMVSLEVGEYAYIRNEGDHREELYALRQDPDEKRNLVDVKEFQEVLGRIRQQLRSSVRDRNLSRPSH